MEKQSQKDGSHESHAPGPCVSYSSVLRSLADMGRGNYEDEKMITSPLLLCRMESEQAADRVLAEVSRSLRNYSFDFQGAKIITGQEEGAYGWITINYLLGKFTQVNTSHRGGGS